MTQNERETFTEIICSFDGKTARRVFRNENSAISYSQRLDLQIRRRYRVRRERTMINSSRWDESRLPDTGRRREAILADKISSTFAIREKRLLLRFWYSCLYDSFRDIWIFQTSRTMKVDGAHETYFRLSCRYVIRIYLFIVLYWVICIRVLNYLRILYCPTLALISS